MTTMPLLFALSTAQFFFGVTLFVTAIFLILLVLVQRGRGGGLSGALGGAGGQSAFGAKAGDTFTQITIGAAGFWILLCAASIIVLQDSGESKFRDADTIPANGELDPPRVGGSGDGSGLDAPPAADSENSNE